MTITMMAVIRSGEAIGSKPHTGYAYDPVFCFLLDVMDV